MHKTLINAEQQQLQPLQVAGPGTGGVYSGHVQLVQPLHYNNRFNRFLKAATDRGMPWDPFRSILNAFLISSVTPSLSPSLSLKWGQILCVIAYTPLTYPTDLIENPFQLFSFSFSRSTPTENARR